MTQGLLWLPYGGLIDNLQVPHDFYQVVDQPAPLAGMRHPDAATPWADIADAGFHHVVCLTGESPVYDPTPLTVLHATRLEDLCHGDPPAEPERDATRIAGAVDVILGALREGRGVVVHCAGGTGRTGTVIGCALRRLGYSAPEVTAYLDEVNIARERAGWPEAEWQAEQVRGFPCRGEGRTG